MTSSARLLSFSLGRTLRNRASAGITRIKGESMLMSWYRVDMRLATVVESGDRGV